MAVAARVDPVASLAERAARVKPAAGREELVRRAAAASLAALKVVVA